VAAKLSDGILVVKRFTLTSGNHQIVVMNASGVTSQPFVLRVE
jgi:hypothetical protein